MWEAPATLEEIIEAMLIGAVVGVVVAIILAPVTAGVGSVIALSASAVLTGAAVGILLGYLLEHGLHLMRHLNEATQLLIQATAQFAQLLAADVQKLNVELQKVGLQIAITVGGVITLATSEGNVKITWVVEELEARWIAAGYRVKDMKSGDPRVCAILEAIKAVYKAMGDTAAVENIKSTQKGYLKIVTVRRLSNGRATTHASLS